MAFDEKFLDELKQKNNIVDVVGKYCVLKKRGNVNHWACCPLPGHTEKTPSFTVNEAGQFFKCFGCGKGGDVITFVMIMENLDYLGAIRLLAEWAGMSMPEDTRDYSEIAKERSDRDRLLALMKETALFYVRNLAKPEAEEFNSYISRRGFDRKTVTAFGMGASFDRFGLVNHLKQKGYTEEEMLKCGVCKKKVRADENGKDTSYIYDDQWGRLIVPIINNLGNVIAFGGRLLEAKPNFGKYNNTQETSLFIKNRTLYNINNLKKEKNLHGITDVIMVEGYMDTIALYQAGFRNVVASMGTSLTVEQARTIKRYADTVIISYDGDGAGQKATIRGLEMFQKEGLNVKVVRLPEGLDPDDVIKKYGADKYRELLIEAMPLVDFKIYNLKKSYNLKDTQSKRKYLNEALKVIAEVESESEREDLLRKLGHDTNTTFESLKRDLDKNSGIKVQKEEPVIERNSSLDGLKNAERFILCAMLFNKSYAKSTNPFLINFTDQVHIRICDIISENREENKEIFPATVAKLFDEKELVEYNAVLSSGDNVFGSNTEERFYIDCLNTVKKAGLESDLKELNAVFSQESDLEKRKQIVKMIAEITAKLAKY
ncbi:MAG: DNA primase [Clostridiales bacterium]|nr:DNA primase [Clostridiales bacterium]